MNLFLTGIVWQMFGGHRVGRRFHTAHKLLKVSPQSGAMEGVTASLDVGTCI